MNVTHRLTAGICWQRYGCNCEEESEVDKGGIGVAGDLEECRKIDRAMCQWGERLCGDESESHCVLIEQFRSR